MLNAKRATHCCAALVWIRLEAVFESETECARREVLLQHIKRCGIDTAFSLDNCVGIGNVENVHCQRDPTVVAHRKHLLYVEIQRKDVFISAAAD